MCKNLSQEQVRGSRMHAMHSFNGVSTSSFFQIEAAFDKYDITGDEMLNYKEFCQMIHHKEEHEHQ